MFSEAKIIFCVAIAFGVGATAALANDKDDYSGGFVIEGSMDGVNPVYHPDLFGNSSKALAASSRAQAIHDRPRRKPPQRY
jgi:hypothetical protein